MSKQHAPPDCYEKGTDLCLPITAPAVGGIAVAPIGLLQVRGHSNLGYGSTLPENLWGFFMRAAITPWVLSIMSASCVALSVLTIGPRL